jgi:hypothetical protein
MRPRDRPQPTSGRWCRSSDRMDDLARGASTRWSAAGSMACRQLPQSSEGLLQIRGYRHQPVQQMRLPSGCCRVAGSRRKALAEERVRGAAQLDADARGEEPQVDRLSRGWSGSRRRAWRVVGSWSGGGLVGGGSGSESDAATEPATRPGVIRSRSRCKCARHAPARPRRSPWRTPRLLWHRVTWSSGSGRYR